MDGLSAAASITAIIDISAKVASLCFQYSVAVKDAKKDIERLGRTITDVKNVLEEVKQLLNREDKTRLSTTHSLSDSLKEYSQQLQAMQTQLKLGKTRKVMNRIGMRALTWPFTSKQMEKSVADLEKYQRTFSLALQIDQT